MAAGDVWTCRWLGNRWVIARVDEPVGKDMKRLYVFGSEEGGKTREEALFWLYRAQSKQGLSIEVPAGWENVEPGLPREEGDEHGDD